MLAFLAFLIVLLVMGHRSSAEEVFTHFENDSGWNSIGTACFVAINGPVITLLGSDSAVHLAEELKDASRNLPRAMLSYAAVNYAIGFIMLLATMFVIGDVQSVLSTSTGEPWIQVIWNATESRGATIAMTAIVAFFFLFAAVNTNTTSSRQLYAFARDGGLPFSSWICKVSQQADDDIDQNRTNQNATRSHQIVTFPSTLSSSPFVSVAASLSSLSVRTLPSSISKQLAMLASLCHILSASPVVSTIATSEAYTET